MKSGCKNWIQFAWKMYASQYTDLLLRSINTSTTIITTATMSIIVIINKRRKKKINPNCQNLSQTKTKMKLKCIFKLC